MKIRELMEDKVVTIDCDASVQALEETLTTHKVSGVPVVSGDGRLMGVVSKTDTSQFRAVCKRQRELGRAPPSPETTQVWEISTPIAITIDAETDVKDGARKMLDHQVHRLIVVDDKEVVGIVSAFDFLRLLTES